MKRLVRPSFGKISVSLFYSFSSSSLEIKPCTNINAYYIKGCHCPFHCFSNLYVWNAVCFLLTKFISAFYNCSPLPLRFSIILNLIVAGILFIYHRLDVKHSPFCAVLWPIRRCFRSSSFQAIPSLLFTGEVNFSDKN